MCSCMFCIRFSIQRAKDEEDGKRRVVMVSTIFVVLVCAPVDSAFGCPLQNEVRNAAANHGSEHVFVDRSNVSATHYQNQCYPNATK